jgi:hypothetical protein
LVLSDNVGDKQCIGVQRQGHTWPPQIALDQYVRGSEIEGGPVKFESDFAQIDGILSEPRRAAKGRDDLSIEVTFVGQLRSKKSIRILRSEDGWYMGTGYGQGGQYPALLVIRNAQDPVVVKKP